MASDARVAVSCFSYYAVPFGADTGIIASSVTYYGCGMTKEEICGAR